MSLTIEDMIVRFGAPAILVGASVEGDVTMILAGVAAHLGLRCVLVQEHWVDWPDAVYDKVGNILLSRIMGADVRLSAAGFDIGIRPSWEKRWRQSRSAAGSRTQSRPARPIIRWADSGSRAGHRRWQTRSGSSAPSSTRSSRAR